MLAPFFRVRQCCIHTHWLSLDARYLGNTLSAEPGWWLSSLDFPSLDRITGRNSSISQMYHCLIKWCDRDSPDSQPTQPICKPRFQPCRNALCRRMMVTTVQTQPNTDTACMILSGMDMQSIVASGSHPKLARARLAPLAQRAEVVTSIGRRMPGALDSGMPTGTEAKLMIPLGGLQVVNVGSGVTRWTPILQVFGCLVNVYPCGCFPTPMAARGHFLDFARATFRTALLVRTWKTSREDQGRIREDGRSERLWAGSGGRGLAWNSGGAESSTGR